LGIIDLTPPSMTELEFSLLGGGKAYGECSVIHMGNNDWGIIDNCVNQKTRKSLSLEYLSSIGVPTTNVKFILCTHWHRDHITNLTEVFKKCPNAKFYLSSALNCYEFIKLIEFKSHVESHFNSAKEFEKLINYVNKSGRKLCRVSENQVIHKTKILDHWISYCSLNPSEETRQYFEASLKKLLENLEPGISDIIKKPDPNMQSIVSCINIGQDSTFVIFGADLENSNQPGLGWNSILKSNMLNSKCKIFKVPHHGSKTSFDYNVWTELIDEAPYLATAPLVNGKHTLLPTIEMIKNLCSFSDKNYLTSDPYLAKEEKFDKKEGKLIKHLGLSIKKIPFEYGHIRFRKELSSKESIEVQLDGSALKLNCKE